MTSSGLAKEEMPLAPGPFARHRIQFHEEANSKSLDISAKARSVASANSISIEVDRGVYIVFNRGAGHLSPDA